MTILTGEDIWNQLKKPIIQGLPELLGWVPLQFMFSDSQTTLIVVPSILTIFATSSHL